MKNENPKSERGPAYKGEITIEGSTFALSAWNDYIKTSGTTSQPIISISARRKTPPEQEGQIPVCIHEVIHTVDDTWNLGLNEYQINILTMGIYDILSENNALKTTFPGK
jgi:hypothetical protein